MAGFGGLGFPLKIAGNPGVFLAVSVGTQWETCGKNRRQGLGTKGFALKKVLSLVLCVAMLLSVMVMGTGAASFTDQDEFSDNYAEAAEVLTGMGIIQGYDDGSFLPQRNINRAQVATMIYRAATGDVTDSKISQFVGEDLFDDVNADDWFAGYVNYCGNAEYIKGFTPDTFGPYKQVTGYQVLAMILRAVGYDENNEYTGDQWTLRVAATAREQGLLDNLNPDTNLAEPATRELVAQLIFEAIQIDTVHYVPAEGDYVEEGSSLGEQVFDLAVTDDTDAWGRPATVWYNDVTDEVYATIEEEALATYTEAVRECDLVDETGVSDVTIYTNGKDNVTTDTLSDDATTNYIGAQGRVVEVYSDRLVVIDTFFAIVTDVVESQSDADGHAARDALLQLHVYDSKQGQTVYMVSDTDWEYTKGTALLLNAYTKSSTDLTVATKNIPVDGYSNNYNVLTYAEETMADSFQGGQTYTTWDNDTHTIDGTVYNDAVMFYLDDAGTNKTEDFNWWLDGHGNIIAVTTIDRTGYAVLKDLIWIDGTPGYAQATLINMDGTEYTATVTSIDGDENYEPDTVANFNWDAIDTEPTLSDSARAGTFDATENEAYVSSNSNYNGTYEGYALYQVYTNDDGTVELIGSNAEGQTDSVINYEGKGTLSANASSILDENGDAVAHISDSTRIIVNNGDGTYSTYTRSTLPDLAGDAMEIFYSVVDGAFTQNVYIKRSVPLAAMGNHLFTISETTGHATGDVVNGEDVIEINAVVDGVETTIQTIDKDVVSVLTDKGNQGKLSHVTYDENALLSTGATNPAYGFVTEVDLVTTETEQSNECDYLYPYTDIHVSEDLTTIECGNVSYNVSNATTIVDLDGTDVTYTIADLKDALQNSALAVWVVESDDSAVNVAATVYVGTKLNAGTDLEDPYIMLGDEKVTGEWNNDTYTITVPYEDRNDAYSLTVEAASDYATLVNSNQSAGTVADRTGDWTNNNGHNKVDATGSQFDDSMIIWTGNNTAAVTDTFYVTVKAEDDHDNTTYTIVVQAETYNHYLANARADALNGEAIDVYLNGVNSPDHVQNAIADALASFVQSLGSTEFTGTQFDFDLPQYEISNTGTYHFNDLQVTCQVYDETADTVVDIVLHYTNA